MAFARYPSADVLTNEAMDATGLSDFGPGDFRVGLEVLLESLERDGDLSPDMDASVIDNFKRRLRNRLEVEEWLHEHPAITQLPVRGPVDINGMPRTGTTALANLLSLDPQFRCLRGWEQARPCPPPTSTGEATDPRRAQAAEENERVSSELKAMHLYELDAATEDSEVLGMSFHGQQYTLPVFGYHRWWRDADLEPTYHYHRRVIQLLQSQRPPNLWLFKSPHHNFHLEAIVAAYPDARFIMTHRDPAKAVPSYASLVSTVFPPPQGERDMRRLGAEVSNHLRVGLENGLAARGRLGEDRFFDVHHRDLVADPLATAERVYHFLQLEMHPPVARAIVDWQQANPSQSQGHRYTAEEFGLRTDRIRSEFAFYINHFDVELED